MWPLKNMNVQMDENAHQPVSVFGFSYIYKGAYGKSKISLSPA